MLVLDRRATAASTVRGRTPAWVIAEGRKTHIANMAMCTATSSYHTTQERIASFRLAFEQFAGSPYRQENLIRQIPELLPSNEPYVHP